MPLDAAAVYDNSTLGPRPELSWLPTKKLSVSAAYQRSLDSDRSKKSIAKIAQTFTWPAFGAVVVCPTEGGWLIIDGQHRVEAARIRGIDTVPCIVLPDMSIAEQAQIFLSTNLTRVTVNVYALYHARLAAGEELAIEVKALCDRAGYSIPRYPIPMNRLAPGQTLVLTLFEKVVKSGSVAARQGIIAAGKAFADKVGGGSNIILKAAIRASEDNRGKSDLIRKWLSAQDPQSLLSRYLGTAGVEELAGVIGRKINAPNFELALPPSSIPFPTREQMMRGK